jgi:dihydroorotase
METTIIRNVTIVSDGRSRVADVLLRNGLIEKIDNQIGSVGQFTEINGEGLHLLPGVIDDQVHFREPGLTHKADIASESRAAVAGGTTSFMEMPNTNPPALSIDMLEQKYARAAAVSPANYSFFMGVSNDNAEEVLRVNEIKSSVCGVKIFMGSSTGNMLVDNYLALEKIFSGTELLIATHCEDEKVIAENKARYPDPSDASFHPLIRDVEACFQSSFAAVQLAKKHDARLHILHISTEKELQLFSNLMPLEQKRITSEVCVHHLHFTSDDYAAQGNLIKCNPAIKAPSNKASLWTALLDDRLDIIATDHAPHTWEEKMQPYSQAPSGVPLVQHALPLMLEYVKQSKLSIEKMVEKMAHAPARCFRIKNKGFIREGFDADLVLVDMDKPYTVTRENIRYKCGWSPFLGHSFPTTILKTFVNGELVYTDGMVRNIVAGKRLQFDR